MPRPPAPKVSPQPAPSGPPIALIGGVAVTLVAVVALLVYLATRGDGLDAAGPANALPEGGGVVVAEAAEGAPQVHLYEDFQCPGCGVLEEVSGAAIIAAADSGEIGLTVTMMSFLDGTLGNDSSGRATNAALCADDAGAFAGYHGAVFAAQPEQEGTGWTDEQLVGFAEAAGLQDGELESFRTCMTQGTYTDYVADMQERANREGVSGSPYVFVDGEALADEDMFAMQQDPTAFEQILQADR